LKKVCAIKNCPGGWHQPRGWPFPCGMWTILNSAILVWQQGWPLGPVQLRSSSLLSSSLSTLLS
jgi:hypothetical protein